MSGPFGEGSAQRIAYRHVQLTPASVWIITHNLSFQPSVVVVDSSRRVFDGDVEYLSDTQIKVSFFMNGQPTAFSGEAYLS